MLSAIWAALRKTLSNLVELGRRELGYILTLSIMHPNYTIEHSSNPPYPRLGVKRYALVTAVMCLAFVNTALCCDDVFFHTWIQTRKTRR
jgi:hypothetical protein